VNTFSPAGPAKLTMPCWPSFAIASDVGVPSTVVVEVTSGAVLTVTVTVPV
jgi:hypothetical protein